ncbi:MAG: putative DNA-binding domain-containing protein [Myxococcota bacterium]|nr:putative DNA-binding domain-containing protein [Myxococcota bacterium]
MTPGGTDTPCWDLGDYERTFLRVCFDAAPAEPDLERLGGLRDRWLLYRRMVRARLREMLEKGLPRTLEAVGNAAWQRAVDAWLARRPPRTRFIREVVPDFAAFAATHWREEPAIAPFGPDLTRYEATRWEVGYRDVAPRRLAAVAFDAPLDVYDACESLELQWAVHEELETAPVRRVVTLCVYRSPATDRVGWIALSPFGAALLDRARRRLDPTLADSVRRAAELTGRPVDAALVTEVGGLLAMLVERGLVAGPEVLGA